ncbi:gluconate 2-dehydrogenase subunit 3 family protein [Mucilaginibacter sp. Bleaf8]|uniref:gluconate 2-dehydrogenase subunit 3 family protein n=1 Tax=Mucilaginibacter sp. Bleaf8 TaxID=2834430 RepID=UPI001BD0930D|nr:gluconate 2-dehydrogenase subunit 3 family protein [Mucilaginibacter sp. Bleaf8]MBS7563262.1 gluconate 2-dehydrogenase subunit 3 family protein [Mucilaginibacter sp. Bleaf8]
MNRREAIERVALLMGGAVIGSEFFLSGCKPAETQVKDLFDAEHVAYMNEVADTILPDTKTPGAKAANVGQFMAVMVRDCYTPEDQKVFVKGLSKLDDACDKKFGKKFMACDAKQRTALLVQLDNEQKEYNKVKKPDEPNHYFRMMKELTLLGYFTSEVGCTKAMRYVPIPGKYVGEIPYKKGDRAWALV